MTSQGNPRVTEFEAVLIERDGMTPAEAHDELLEAHRRVVEDGEDPEDILHYDYGLEPDYVFDILSL